jgi:hypothetical protein
VHNHGDILLNGKRLFLTESLCNEYVGLELVDEDISFIWYCDYLLGQIDHRKWRIEPIKIDCLSPQLTAEINEHKPKKVLPMSLA